MGKVDEVMLRQCTLKVAFIVADDTALDGDTELHIYNSIHGRIASIDLYHQNDIDSGSANLEKYDLVLVSDKVTYTNVDELTVLKVPIISFNGSVSNNILHIGSSNGNSTVTQTKITDQTHNITREQVTNSQKIYNPAGGGPVDYVGGISSEAISLAEDIGDLAKKHLVVVDRGRILANEEEAPELRLHFGFYDKNNLTQLGKTLFTESIMYGLCGRGPMEVEVRQISERIESYKNIPLIALIVGDKTDLDENTETFFKDRLEEDHIVHVYDDGDIDDGTANLESYDLIIVSKQVADANIDELTTLERPILSMKGSISAAKLHIGSTSGNNATETNINITDNTHNITRDQSTDSQAVYSGTSGMDYIETLGDGAVDLAENPLQTSQKYLVVVDEGKRLQDDTRAPDHRIHFGLYQGDQLNDLGLVLFDEAVQYGLAGAKRIDVNIEGDVDQILPAVSYKTVPEVGFIVADKSNLNIETEEVFYNRLSETCYVTLIDDDDIDAGNMNLRKFNVIIVSHEVDHTKLDVELPILKIPILSMKGEVSDDILKMGTSNGEDPGDRFTLIEDNTHNITTGEATELGEVYKADDTMDYISDLSTDALVLTRDQSQIAQKHLVVVNKMRILADSTRAPERRIHFAFFNGGELTDLGWRLFDNAIEYLFRGYYQEIDVISAGSRIFGMFQGITPVGSTPGVVYFADATNGNDANDGLTLRTAKATVGAAHGLSRAGQNDTVIVLKGNYSNELVTCDKASVHIIGMGQNQCSGLAFLITADSIEIAGFTINHSTQSNLVEFANPGGSNCWIHDNKITNGAGTGVRFNSGSSSACLIENNIIKDNNSDGINLATNESEITIKNNIIEFNGGYGVYLNENATYCNICDNSIVRNSNIGINIAGYYNTIARNLISRNNIGSLPTYQIQTFYYNSWIDNKGVAVYDIFTLYSTSAPVDVLTNIDVPRTGEIVVMFDVQSLVDAGDVGMITVRAVLPTADEQVLDKTTYILGEDEGMPTLRFSLEGGANLIDLTFQISTAIPYGERDINIWIIFGDG